ncbi:MAG: DUF421 domain-containing protein [Clostridia bacterium]|nr:DUF421 domain-containing protein [Clostridia bacterium]
MATVLIRTVIIYLVFVFSIRLLGKRQVGELELSELIITFMLSELATVPIQDPSVPLSFVLIPVVILLSFEVAFSFLVTKSNFLKKIIIGNPSYIIKKGKLNQKELSKLRMSLGELLGELRLKDVSDISTVDYAVLEENGKLSVFKKIENGKKSPGIAHALVIDGSINESNLKISGKTEKYVYSYLKKHNLELENVFLLTCDDEGTSNLIIKEEK